jgi:hypothetical protein
MALPVYSVRFLSRRNLTGGATYLVPAGMVAVVRDIDAFDGSLTGDNVLQVSGASGSTFAFWRSPVAIGAANAGNAYAWRGRQILNAGEELQLNADSGLDVAVSGYLLTIP